MVWLLLLMLLMMMALLNNFLLILLMLFLLLFSIQLFPRLLFQFNSLLTLLFQKVPNINQHIINLKYRLVL